MKKANKKTGVMPVFNLSTIPSMSDHLLKPMVS
jgi:hypothetical protein